MVMKPTYEELEQRVKKLEKVDTKRKQAEKALAESEQRYQLLAESMSDVIWITDRNLRYTYVSPSVERLLGYTPEELIGRTIMDHLTPFSIDAGTNKFLEILARDNAEPRDLPKSGMMELQRIHKDGSCVWASISFTFLRDEEGRPAGLLGITRDITDRKRAEEAMQESERRFHAIFSQTFQFIGLMNPAGTLIEANRSSLDFGDLEESDVLGKPFWETPWWTHSPELQEQLRDAVNKATRGEFVRFEAWHPGVDGEIHYVDISITPVKDPAGNVVLLIPEGRDITDLKFAEQALKDSEQRNRLLVQNSSDIIAVFDQDFTIRYIGPSVEKILGYESDRIIEQDGSFFIHPEDLERTMEAFSRCLYNPEEPIYVRHRCRHKDGSWRLLETLGINLLHNPSMKGILVNSRDITTRMKMEEELKRIDMLESLGVLAGGLAHDFNNTLTPILANISIARMHGQFDDEILELLTDAEKAVLRAKGLTQQLLTFSKGGAPIKKTIHLSRLLKDTAKFALSGSNVRCECSIPDDLWPVEVDEGQISQVIHNIVINADQAMAEGGTLKIRADNLILSEKEHVSLKGGRYVKICIEDPGHGIPQEQLSKIFDPFFTIKEKGRGLGLATSLSIVASHEGHIHVDSKMGVGTNFHIYLPASEKKPEMKGKAKDKPIKGKGKVLLVDDEEIIRKSAREVLKRLGYQIQTAKDHAEGIKLYEKAMEGKHPFDAVIMDLTIPGSMGGKEAIKKLKKIDRDAKVIVSSGYSDDLAMSKFREYGFCGVVAKPYEIGDLARVIHNVLKG